MIHQIGLPKQRIFTTEEAIALITKELQTLSAFEIWLKNKPAMEPICYARNSEDCPLTKYFRWQVGDRDAAGSDRFHFRVTSERFEMLTHSADVEIPMSAIAYLFVRRIDEGRSVTDIVRVANARIALKRARLELEGAIA